MFNINIVQWRGNKDVSLLSLVMASVPRIEDHLEFHSEGRLIKGKVTRVSYKLTVDGQGDPCLGETQVRINTK